MSLSTRLTSIVSGIRTSPQDIDYKNNLFEHLELTRIVGEPITVTLIILQAKVRDNAQSVQSTMLMYILNVQL